MRKQFTKETKGQREISRENGFFKVCWFSNLDYLFMVHRKLSIDE